MATFPLRDRHELERRQATRRAAQLETEIHTRPNPEIPGGDGRYRVPTIGLNSGHSPGTRPDLLDFGVDNVRKTWSNAAQDVPADA